MTLFSYFSTAAKKEKAGKSGTEEHDMANGMLCIAVHLLNRIHKLTSICKFRTRYLRADGKS